MTIASAFSHPTKPETRKRSSIKTREKTEGPSDRHKVQRAPRTRITVSLSETTMRLFDELKKCTDADTDSEVFRNALRLHLSLLKAHLDGKTFCVKDSPGATPVALPLFIQEDAVLL